MYLKEFRINQYLRKYIPLAGFLLCVAYIMMPDARLWHQIISQNKEKEGISLIAQEASAYISKICFVKNIFC